MGNIRSVAIAGVIGLTLGAACADDTAEPSSAPDEALDAGDDAQDASEDASVSSDANDVNDASDGAVSVEPVCAIELSPMPQTNEPKAQCRVDTYGSLDDPGSLSFSVAQGQRWLMVFWEHRELTPGSEAQLPFVDAEGRAVSVDYSTNVGTNHRAVRGTVRMTSVVGRYYGIELEGVGFAGLPDFELNGTIGGELQKGECIVCN